MDQTPPLKIALYFCRIQQRWILSDDKSATPYVPEARLQEAVARITAAEEALGRATAQLAEQSKAAAKVGEERDDLLAAWETIFASRKINGMSHREAAQALVAENADLKRRLEETEARFQSDGNRFSHLSMQLTQTQAAKGKAEIERDEARQQLATAQAEAGRLREGVRFAAQKFRQYQRMHLVKGPSGDDKARANAECAERMENALSAQPTGPAAAEPTRVCFCGSSKWPELHMAAMMEETLVGRIVIPMGLYGHADFPAGAKTATNDGDESTAVKQNLDTLHFAKIRAADEVLVITVNGYIGSSTKREIAYAQSLGKPVRYKDAALSAEPAGPSVGELLKLITEILRTLSDLLDAKANQKGSQAHKDAQKAYEAAVGNAGNAILAARALTREESK